MKYGKLAVGVVSPEACRAVYEYSHEQNVPLMLIASMNQVDTQGGYTGLSTESWLDLCNTLEERYWKANVALCRDHCGPGFPSKTHWLSLAEDDIIQGIDLIHFDFAFDENPIDSLRLAMRFALTSKPEIDFEVGTEENTGNVAIDFEKLERDIEA